MGQLTLARTSHLSRRLGATRASPLYAKSSRSIDLSCPKWSTATPKSGTIYEPATGRGRLKVSTTDVVSRVVSRDDPTFDVESDLEPDPVRDRFWIIGSKMCPQDPPRGEGLETTF